MNSFEFVDILMRLLIAHFLADFALQPFKWVKDKDAKKLRSKYLYFHVLLHGILTYVLVADWRNFLMPLLIIAIHFLIDVLKIYRKKNFIWFVIDQLLHIISLLFIWMIFYHQKSNALQFISETFALQGFWIVLLGLVLIVHPVSIFIYQATKKWQAAIPQEKDDSLKEVGKWIGILERILIFTFILIGQFSAIGFLLAAKSIFRFGDLTEKKDRKLTEYIVIGTFLSFTITILIGLLVKHLL